MARLSLAVGYTSRGNSRSEEPVQLYLGTSFQAAKEAAFNPPPGIGYTEAYRLVGGPQKRHHVPAAESPPAPDLELLPEEPEAKPAKKAAKEAPAEA